MIHGAKSMERIWHHSNLTKTTAKPRKALIREAVTGPLVTKEELQRSITQMQEFAEKNVFTPQIKEKQPNKIQFLNAK